MSHHVANRSSAPDPLWYKDAIIYQAHVRSFRDSNGDGVGDFAGLIDKLDYIRSLGVTAVWLLPFYPSPLRDDGYDVADYTAVNPLYGSLEDAKRFITEAHRLGLRVITELVCNHTSDQHPWFQRARRAKPGSVARDYYVWSDTPDKYADARIIFTDSEPSNWEWDPVAQAYYWHRFFRHQPDLNFDNPHVRRAMIQALDFWLTLGVDGLRLDAVPYLYEREGTNCENLPQTHQFLREVRRYVDQTYPGRMLLCEANQWPADVSAYFGDGDECHMAFHFPLMPRLYLALNDAESAPIVEALRRTPTIPESAQWALFLRNHDELTLEMVTDEERDALYRAYAKNPRARLNVGIRRRLAPLLMNDRRQIELLNGLLFSLPGTPIVYYGDEIGMGDNIYLDDRHGVRTPMQWSDEKNAGFSEADPSALVLPVITDGEFHYQAVNVRDQEANRASLLSWMRRIIAIRKRYRAFGRGSIDFVETDTPAVLAFLRRYGDETLLVVANLSRQTQAVRLDLRAVAGRTPIELFGGAVLPAIGDAALPLTVGPHAFHWFALQSDPALSSLTLGPVGDGVLRFGRRWEDVLTARSTGAWLADFLPRFLDRQAWRVPGDGPARAAKILDHVQVAADHGAAHLCLVQIETLDDRARVYLLPVAFASGEAAASLQRDRPHAIIAPAVGDAADGVLYDATHDHAFADAVRLLALTRRRTRARHGELNRDALAPSPARATVGHVVAIHTMDGATHYRFADQVVVRLFHHVEPGVHPDWEIAETLTALSFPATPALVGALDWRLHAQPESFAVAVARVAEPDSTDARSAVITAVVDAATQWRGESLASATDAAAGAAEFFAPRHESVIGGFATTAAVLGVELAALHCALATKSDSPAFAPEPFTEHFQKALAFGMGSRLSKAVRALRDVAPHLAESDRVNAEQVLANCDFFESLYHPLQGAKIAAARVRGHGALTLAAIAVVGDTVCFRSFDGDPTRPLSERRLKQSPLRDVASVVASCHDAVQSARREMIARGADAQDADAFALAWFRGFGAAFLPAYRAGVAPARFLPPDDAVTLLLFRAFLADRFWTDLLSRSSDMLAVSLAVDGLRTVQRGFGGAPAASVPRPNRSGRSSARGTAIVGLPSRSDA